MEIVIAAAFCIWLTAFAVWAYLAVKKDYHDLPQQERQTSEEDNTE